MAEEYVNVTLRLPRRLHAGLRVAMALDGLSGNAWLIRMIENTMETDRYAGIIKVAEKLNQVPGEGV